MPLPLPPLIELRPLLGDVEPAEYRRQAHSVIRSRINSANSPYPTKQQEYYRVVSRLKRRNFGRDAAKAIRSGDLDAMIDLVNNYYYYIPAHAHKIFSNASSDYEDSVRLCDRCNDTAAFHDDMEFVGGDLWCQGCVEDYSVYSDCMEQHIPENLARPIYDGHPERRDPDDYATGAWLRNSDDHYFSDRFDVWMTESAFNEYDVGPDDDDDDDDDDSGLADYHATRRNFVIHDAKPSTAFPPLGIEVEVYADYRRDAVYQIQNNAPPGAGPLILERDSSLDDDHGFEVVTNPLGRDEWLAFGPKLCDLLGKHCPTYATDEDSCNSYGIHVNLGRDCITPMQEARMMMFLCAVENQQFVTRIAQRNRIYHADVNMGALPKPEQKLVRIGGIKGRANGWEKTKHSSYGKLYGAGKYAPINFKDNVLEFRIFNSTIDTVEFMKNLEFVWALARWVSPHSCTGTSWHYKDFIAWLSSPAVALWKEYPNLAQYLTRDGAFNPIDVAPLPKEKTPARPSARPTETTPLALAA